MKDPAPLNILISPLNWGSGHITRSQDVAYKLRERGHRIFFAAAPSAMKTINPAAYSELIPLKSLTVRYSSVTPQYIAVFFQLPLILISFLNDRMKVNRLCRKNNIDVIISDNRFGFRNKKVYSVYITHQLNFIFPGPFSFAAKAVSHIHRFIASRYDECWIPDYPGKDNLSGSLSHDCRLTPGTSYIGPLSHLSLVTGSSDIPEPEKQKRERAVYSLAIISGPEPQRSIFEKIVIRSRYLFPGRLVIAAGKPGNEKKPLPEDVIRYPWADSRQLKKIAEDAELIICRSGYSTIADLFSLGRPALLVPTPGQPEQEYLAKYLSGKYGFVSVPQSDLSGAENIPVTAVPASHDGRENSLTDMVIDKMIRRLPV